MSAQTSKVVLECNIGRVQEVCRAKGSGNERAGTWCFSSRQHSYGAVLLVIDSQFIELFDEELVFG